MPETFFKFPRTPHLIWNSDKPARDDRVLSRAKAREFVSSDIVVEEKIDGANLGISFTEDGAVQVRNRGSYLERPAPPQFQPLWGWLSRRRDLLADVLGSKLILFGEWCYVVHSARYDHLPDWFLAFDVYDRDAKRFWSSERRNALIVPLGVARVPEIGRGRFSVDELGRLLSSSRSSYGPELVEGLYLRREANGWLEGRAKIVRPDFTQSIQEHWSARPFQRNLTVR
jgi:hypothetical protein